MPIDILLDQSFDLLTGDGDFVAGEATRQHQSLILLTEKGENREFPSRGVGIQTYLLDEQAGSPNALIKREFEADGMTVEAIRGTGWNLTTEAKYGTDSTG